eukprot:CAMPEP_0118903182 /NCGR_PEP_ID=MMETSP1166-20130328/8155_1 /TAXON_ID=1104430 /ORGANISM="Chrysoreinhardia sp, Strain CCMP3193" /LENGTH=267 /DNA_ID=CAMNT_0006842407 /DNA_START=42 /DNA_END=842 /DNA_ORIENTATION=+
MAWLFPRLTILVGRRRVEVALVGDAMAMHAAVTAALRDVLLDGDSWWLVDGEQEMVALSSDLPDGCQLGLRTSSGNVKSREKGVDFLNLQTPEWVAPKRLSEDELGASAAFFNLSNKLSARAQREPHRAHKLIHMDRIQKKSCHLSNKRTFLAWVRTSLSAERLVLLWITFADFEGPSYLQHIYFASVVCMCVWTLLCGFTGWERYVKIKRAVDNNEHLAVYSRGTIQPVIFLLGAICAFLAVSVWGHFITPASKKDAFYKHQQNNW